MTVIFQYGSNLSSARLNSTRRLRGEARYLGLARTREPHEFAFTVWSEGNRCAAADLIPGHGRRIWGALYEIPEALVRRETAGGRPSMDSIENEGVEYERVTIDVMQADGKPVAEPVITWLVRERRHDLRTSFEYVRHILLGLHEKQAPLDYIDYVRERIVANNPELQEEIDRFLAAY